MADLAYTDVTLTIIRKDMARKEKMNKWTLTWAGSLSYPTGGVPIGASVAGAIRRFGMSREVDVEFLEVPQDGFVYKFDRTNMKILMYQSAAVTPTNTLTNGTAGAAMTFNSGHIEATGGGTLTGNVVAAAVLVELGNVAVATKTFRIRATGV